MPFCGASGKTKKQEEFAKREQEILNAALSLFEGPHWEQVTVEQISRKAEIGKGTVYKHFASKEEIYAYITIAFTEQLMNEFERVVDSAQVLESLKNIIRVAFDLFLANPAQARVSYYCKREDYRYRLTEELKRKFEALDELFECFIGELLQAGINSGFIPNNPVEHLMMGLSATFDGAITMVWNGDSSYQHADDLDDYVNIISGYMMAGLLGLNKSG